MEGNMLKKYEDKYVISYEAYTNVRGKRKFLYASDTIDDLKRQMEKNAKTDKLDEEVPIEEYEKDLYE